MAETEHKANGDVEKEIRTVPSKSQSEPPKIVDVELVVDGFGFMPKVLPIHKDRPSKIFDKTTKDKDVTNVEVVEEEHAKSPCDSSSNIDIVRRYTWTTRNRMTVQVITYGATITVIKVPDKKGNPEDVIAGFDTLEEYFQPRNPYFGGTVGRYANIIRDGTFIVRPSGRTYMVSHNKHHNHYHGGYIGFDKVNWRGYVSGKKVIMSHVSERFHEGYPGTIMAQVCFEVTCDNFIKIEMKCTTSEPTIINLSNSLYFNLAGHHTGCETMYDHIFTINADKYTAADDEGVTTGEKKVVGGTPYDLRVPRLLRVMLPQIPMGGYDLNYCISKATKQDLIFHARALHPVSGRVVEVYSNQPGTQFYTGNQLPDPDKIVELVQGGEEGEMEGVPKGEGESESEASDAEAKSEQSSALGEEEQDIGSKGSKGKVSYGYVPLVGKQGMLYKKHGLFCITPQNYPDACNHKNFPSSVLNPGEVYVHKIQYRFGLLLGRYM